MTRFGSVALRLGALVFACPVASAYAQGADTASYGQSGGPNRNAARTLYDAGETDFRAKNYEAALAKFTDARASFAAPTVALRIAQCKENLKRYIEASELYLEVILWKVKDGDPPPYKTAVSDAKTALDALKPKIPKLRVTVSPKPADLELRLDDKPFAASFIGLDANIDPGVHKLSLTAKGFTPITQSFSADSGQQVQVKLTPVAEAPVQTPTVPVTPVPETPAPETLAGDPKFPIPTAGLVTPAEGNVPKAPPAPKLYPKIALTGAGGIGLWSATNEANQNRRDFDPGVYGTLGVGARFGPVTLLGLYRPWFNINTSELHHSLGAQVGYLTSVDHVGAFFAADLSAKFREDSRNSIELGAEFGVSIPLASSRVRLIPGLMLGVGRINQASSYYDGFQTYTTNNTEVYVVLAGGVTVHFDFLSLSEYAP
jgi:hypothetical protein